VSAFFAARYGAHAHLFVVELADRLAYLSMAASIQSANQVSVWVNACDCDNK
jgi:hypothetical protein